MNVAIYVGIVTITHLIAYAVFVHWTTKVKAGGDAKEGEVIDHVWDGDLREMNNPLPGWWLVMFYLMLVVGVAYLALYPGVFATKFSGILDWSSASQYEEQKAKVDAKAAEYFAVYDAKTVEELANIPDAVASGRRIFLNNCAVCHASDAGGIQGQYPNLSDNDWLWGGEADQIVHSITHGRIGAMPPGGALADPSDETVTAVANYVMQLGNNPTDAALAEKGKVFYEQSCFACHGIDGKGNTLLGAPNLTDDIWLYSYDANIEDIKAQILNPTNNVMPAWLDFLGETKIKVVAAYVYSLSN